MAYFDCNASAPMSRAVKDAVRGAMEHLVGNPSSDHDLGKEVRKRVEQCRTNLATWLGTQPENIVWNGMQVMWQRVFTSWSYSPLTGTRCRRSHCSNSN